MVILLDIRVGNINDDVDMPKVICIDLKVMFSKHKAMNKDQR